MATSVWPEGFEGPIADVVSMAAHIELALENLVMTGLWRHRAVAQFVLRNLATEKLVGIAEAIVLEALPAQADLARAVFKSVREGRAERNALLHRVWRPAPDGTGLRMTPRPGRDELQVRDLESVKRLGEQLGEATIGLTVLQAELWTQTERDRHADRSSPKTAPDESRA